MSDSLIPSPNASPALSPSPVQSLPPLSIGDSSPIATNNAGSSTDAATPNILLLNTEQASVTENAKGLDNEQASVTENAKDKEENPWAKVTADIWIHFQCKVINGKKVATCIYCEDKMLGGPKKGTTHLRKHLERCKRRKNVDIRQQALQANFNKEKFELSNWSFNQDVSREDLAMAIIEHEYPLMMVDHRGFRRFCKGLNPNFKMVSRNTIKADCLRIYEKEKKALMEALEKNEGRVAITIDMWTTSNQNRGYMVVTAHYIDKHWKLQRRIIRFVHVPCPHTSEVLCNALVQSLLDWNLDSKLSTITVDNCSTNDSMMRMIVEKLPSDSLLLNGSIIHMRCAAHILNLVVKKGLEVIGDAIENIKESVGYWTHTPKRWEKFEETTHQLHIPIGKKLSLDCDTRWNSTYLMLQTALEYKDVFFHLKQRDSKYKHKPSELDWNMTREICARLKVFYSTTELFSGTKYPTANLYFSKICEIRFALCQWKTCGIGVIENMAVEMMTKFEKYWSILHGIIGIAIILDPRYKLILVEFYFNKIYGEVAEFEVEKIKFLFRQLVEQYELKEKMKGESSMSCAEEIDNILLEPTDLEFEQFASSKRKAIRSDLDLYLEEDILPRTLDFDILSWWKMNKGKYPILHQIARDVLAIPISTVSSESAFSTSGRVIDSHRSRLHQKTVEALMCAQDWLSVDSKKEKVLGVADSAHATMMYDSDCDEDKVE